MTDYIYWEPEDQENYDVLLQACISTLDNKEGWDLAINELYKFFERMEQKYGET